MPTIDREIALTFCKHCDWAYQCWLVTKHLFDDNPRKNLLSHPHHQHFFVRLSVILQEYWLQEVAKLHDPPVQSGQSNLSIPYVLQFGGWDHGTENALEVLKSKLSVLETAVKGARNKLLAHNDLTTIVSGKTLGAFKAGDDVAYFEALQQFASLIHEKVIGGPYLFDDLTENDVHVFLSAFSKGVT